MNTMMMVLARRWTVFAGTTVVAVVTQVACALDPENVGDEPTGGGSGSASSGSESSGSMGSTSAGTGSEDPTGQDTTGGPPAPIDVGCEGEVEIMQFDGVTPSGFRECADGFVHLWQEQTCLIPEAPATCSTEQGGTCSSSADCTEFPNGACLDDPSILAGCGCVYGCETSADCGEGEVCACTGAVDPWPVCVPAGCTDPMGCGDEDPEDGVDALCGLGIKQYMCGNLEIGLACLTPQSECRDTCPAELTCYDDLLAPPCNIVDGAWACDIDALCDDCG